MHITERIATRHRFPISRHSEYIKYDLSLVVPDLPTFSVLVDESREVAWGAGERAMFVQSQRHRVTDQSEKMYTSLHRFALLHQKIHLLSRYLYYDLTSIVAPYQCHATLKAVQSGNTILIVRSPETTISRIFRDASTKQTDLSKWLFFYVLIDLPFGLKTLTPSFPARVEIHWNFGSKKITRRTKKRLSSTLTSHMSSTRYFLLLSLLPLRSNSDTRHRRNIPRTLYSFVYPSPMLAGIPVTFQRWTMTKDRNGNTTGTRERNAETESTKKRKTQPTDDRTPWWHCAIVSQTRPPRSQSTTPYNRIHIFSLSLSIPSWKNFSPIHAWSSYCPI